MRLLSIIVALMAVLAVAAYGIGYTLPQHFSTIRATSYSQPIETVWHTITDMDSLPQWNKGIAQVSRIDTGDGEVWRLTDSSGHFMDMKTVESVPPIRRVVRIQNSDQPLGGEWVFELQEAGNGTLLRITENAEIQSPLFRFISRHIIGNAHGLENYLLALGEHFGENPVIEK